MRNNLEWTNVKGKTDDDMISCIEKILDIHFPVEYLECIRSYPNGRPHPKYFKTEKKTFVYEEGGSFDYLYNFEPESVSNLLKQYHGINYHSGENSIVPDGIIPFASASFNHDELCFDYRQGFPPKIIFLDNEAYGNYLAFLEDPKNCKEVKEEDILIHVCDSFGELLDMLEEEPKDE